MRAQLQKLWALVALASSAASQQEKRTYSYNQFTPTLWTNQPAATPAPSNGSGSSGSPVPYKLQTPPLDTPWTEKVGLSPWPEHPRPQLKRDSWKNLNGIWTWQPVGTGNDSSVPSLPQGKLQYETLVPSCIESAISGLQELNTTSMWYETQFSVPSDWSGQHVLLHFEAVDYASTVFINGQQAGNFTGGYFRNTVDATKFLSQNGTNEL